MSDLVERLRSLADCDARAGEPLGKCMREAADEIERLNAVVMNIEIGWLRTADMYHKAVCCVPPHPRARPGGADMTRSEDDPTQAEFERVMEIKMNERAQIWGLKQFNVVMEKRANAAEAERDGAYCERNLIVAALAKLFPSGIKRTDIPGWEPEWHGCVYIDLPTGQCSWHFHDREAHLFENLPPYAGEWDGHDTPEKYRRLAALTPVRAPEERP